MTSKVSGKHAGTEKMRWQGVTRPWQLVGGGSEVRGWVVSGDGWDEGRGGRPEVAATPYSLDAGTERIQHWTLPMPASNESKRWKAEIGFCFKLMFRLRFRLRFRKAWVKVGRF